MTYVGHALVNFAGILCVTALSLWGELDELPAVGAILVICGVWGLNTRSGPPSAAAGLAGLLGWLSQWR